MDRGATNEPDRINSKWKSIWKNPAPPKVCTFARKLTMNGLATHVFKKNEGKSFAPFD
jgi:hypothetical protein